MIYLRLTDRCNLSCTHCYREKFYGDLVLPELEKEHVILSGGEPFLYPDLERLSEFLGKQGYVTATTSLVFEWSEKIQSVLEKIDDLKISYDFNLRGYRDSQKILFFSNLEKVKKIKDVSLQICLDKHTTEMEPKDVYAFVENLGIKKVYFERLANVKGLSPEIIPDVDTFNLFIEKSLKVKTTVVNQTFLDFSSFKKYDTGSEYICSKCSEIKTITNEGVFGCIVYSDSGKCVNTMRVAGCCYSCDLFNVCPKDCQAYSWDTCRQFKALIQEDVCQK